MFEKKDSIANDRVIYRDKPNIIFGCKKAIFGFIVLIIVISISSLIIRLIGEMQVYLVSYIKLSLTRYVTIGLFVIMLLIILYIIWQLISWYSKEYILTESKIIIISGVLFTRKKYMPYFTIQDINTSQSILARLFNIGSVSIYNAYDNNQMSIENISNPSKVEEIIFSKISQNTAPSHYNNYNPQNFYNDENDNVISPITHENNYNSHEQDYPPEYTTQKTDYEYESYSESLEYPNYEETYDVRDNNYSYDDINNDYKEDINPDSDSNQNDAFEDSRENAIKRHFDKFKK